MDISGRDIVKALGIQEVTSDQCKVLCPITVVVIPGMGIVLEHSGTK